MKKIKWRKKYTIGIEFIDLQHQYFASMINRLIDEVDESDDIYYQNRMLEELSLYASFHFISEENFMIKHGYPDLEDHVAQHRQLLSQLNDKINYLTLEKLKIVDVIDYTQDWFFHHTLEIDSLFGTFITRKE